MLSDLKVKNEKRKQNWKTEKRQRIMRNKIVKVLCGILAVGMCFSLVGCDTLSKIGANDAADISQKVENASEILEMTNAYRGTNSASNVMEEGETVYVLADAKGNVNKVIRSEKVEGEEESYYEQKESSEKPPVDVAVSYFFKGERVNPEEILGETGDLTIRFDYKNNTSETVTIDGKEEKVCVPFTMMSGLILDNETFRDVSAVNAKIIDDGSRSIVIGYAFPGLQDNLKLSEDVFDIPEYVEIKANVKDFKMAPSITLATNELFNEEEPDGREKLNNLEKDLNDDLDKLTDASGKLKDGSKKLSDGLTTLSGKTAELKDGVGKLADGAAALSDGTGKLKDGAGTLANGTGDLKKGVGSLANGAGKLADGVGSLQKGAAGLSDGVEKVDGGVADLQSGLNTLSANNEALQTGSATIFQTLLASASAALSDAGMEGVNLTIENYDAVLDSVIASLDPNAVSANARQSVEAGVDAMGDGLYDAYLKENEQQIYASFVASQIDAAGMAAAEENGKEAPVECGNEITESGEEMPESGVEATENGAKLQESGDEVENRGDGLQENATKEDADMRLTKEQMIAAAVANLTDEQKAAILAGAKSALTEEQKAAIRQGAIERAMGGEQVQEGLAKAQAGAAKIAQLKAQLDAYNQFYQGLNAYTNGVAQAAEGAGKLKNGTEALKQGAASLKEGTDQLKNGADSLKGGADQLSAGVNALNNGAAALRDGIEKVDNGAGELSNGTAKLNGNMPALQEGINSLKEGAGTLSDGLVKFDEEGVKRLMEVKEDKLDTLSVRIEGLREASGEYTEEKAKGKGSIKFLYRMDGAE